MNKASTASLSLLKTAAPIALLLFLVLTAANFVLLMPKGILAKTLGLGGAYQTNVLSLFSDRQIVMFYISVLCAVIIACTAHVLATLERKS
jgi:hypothetical protein